MEFACEITQSERIAVKHHIFNSDKKLSYNTLNKILLKYELSLVNANNKILDLKMDLDDRELAFKLFLDGKLKKEDIENIINNG